MRIQKTRTVPARLHPACEQPYTEFTCDGCGRLLDEQGTEEDCLHELCITLDRFRCVSSARMREYCPACLESVWGAISKLIGADPDLTRDDCDYD
jgi:hypothetical protein